jgi:hypothetical protein
MSEENQLNQPPETIRVVYQQICKNHRTIGDFRAKLLVFLPLATAVAIPLMRLLDDKTRLFLGIFGFLISLGLYFYEFLANLRCEHLIKTGKQLEALLAVSGPYTERPTGLVGFVNEAYLARVIYSVVLAAWIYGAFSATGSVLRVIMAFVVLAFFFFIPRLLKFGHWPL